MGFWTTAVIVFLLCAVINLPFYVMDQREDQRKKQGESAEQPRSAEPRLQKEKRIQEKEPVEDTPAAEEKTVQSQGAVALYNAMYAMHQHEYSKHEITEDPKLVQRLNQIHHNLTYGDSPEVDYPTVIRLMKKYDGHALNWTIVSFIDYHYDDNGILRKIETT